MGRPRGALRSRPSQVSSSGRDDHTNVTLARAKDSERPGCSSNRNDRVSHNFAGSKSGGEEDPTIEVTTKTQDHATATSQADGGTCWFPIFRSSASVADTADANTTSRGTASTVEQDNTR